MRRTLAAISLLILSFMAHAVAIETVYVPASNVGWKFGDGSDRRGSTFVEFIPTDENISSWTKMFTIQFLEASRDSPSEVVEKLRGRMASRCPPVQWKVISQEATSITYEWSIKDCNGEQDQSELARLLKGNDGIHRIAYTKKLAPLDGEEREAWLKAFTDAYVQKDAERVVIAP